MLLLREIPPSCLLTEWVAGVDVLLLGVTLKG